MPPVPLIPPQLTDQDFARRVVDLVPPGWASTTAGTPGGVLYALARALGSQLSFILGAPNALTVTVGGTPAANDAISLVVTLPPAILPAPRVLTHVVVPAEGVDDVAAALGYLVGADPELSAIGVDAEVDGAIVTVTWPSVPLDAVWTVDPPPVLTVAVRAITVPEHHATVTVAVTPVPATGSLAYAAAATRIQTALGDALDLAATDQLDPTSSAYRRYRGEPDAAYRVRVLAALLPTGATRAAVSAAITAVTGAVPRIVEPWNPVDTGVVDGVAVDGELLGAIYADVDTATWPGRATDPGLRYQGFVDSLLPTLPILNGNPLPCADDGLYADAPNGEAFDLYGDVPPGAAAVYAAINRVKVLGTVVWVRFPQLAPPAPTPAPTEPTLTADDGLYADVRGRSSTDTGPTTPAFHAAARESAALITRGGFGATAKVSSTNRAGFGATASLAATTFVGPTQPLAATGSFATGPTPLVATATATGFAATAAFTVQLDRGVSARFAATDTFLVTEPALRVGTGAGFGATAALTATAYRGALAYASFAAAGGTYVIAGRPLLAGPVSLVATAAIAVVTTRQPVLTADDGLYADVPGSSTDEVGAPSLLHTVTAGLTAGGSIAAATRLSYGTNPLGFAATAELDEVVVYKSGHSVSAAFTGTAAAAAPTRFSYGTNPLGFAATATLAATATVRRAISAMFIGGGSIAATTYLLPRWVQTVHQSTGGGGASNTIALPAVGTDDAIVGVCFAATPPTSIVDNAGNSYTILGSASWDGVGYYQTVFYRSQIAGNPTQLILDQPAIVGLTEYANVSAVNASAGPVEADGIAPAAAVTTTVDNCLIWTTIFSTSTSNATPIGFTLRDDDSASIGELIADGYQLVAGTADPIWPGPADADVSVVATVALQP